MNKVELFLYFLFLPIMVVSCDAAQATNAPAPTINTPTPIPIVEYLPPGADTGPPDTAGILGTLTGKLHGTMDFSNNKISGIESVEVKLDDGQVVNAKLSGSVDKIIQGGRVILEYDDDERMYTVLRYTEIEVVGTEVTEIIEPDVYPISNTLTFDAQVRDFVISEEAVWVVTSSWKEKNALYQLSKIDPNSGEITKTIDLLDKAYPKLPVDMTISDNILWIQLGDSFYKVDKKAFTFEEVIRNDDYKLSKTGINNFIVVGNYLWTSGSLGGVQNYVLIRYDLSSGQVEATETYLPIRFISSHDGFVLATTTIEEDYGLMSAILVIDPDNGNVVDTLNINMTKHGRAAETSMRPINPLLLDNSIWFTHTLSTSLVEVDRQGGDRIAEYLISSNEVFKWFTSIYPERVITYGENAIWIAQPVSGSIIRFDLSTRVITDVFNATEIVHNPQYLNQQVWVQIGQASLGWIDVTEN